MNNLKALLQSIAFSPNLFSAVGRDRLAPRVYFGPTPRTQIGGPAVRIARMKRAFGNAWVRPNIIYVSSSWNEEYFSSALRLKRRRGVRLVYNQNGFYYPAWYKGDWRKKNEAMVRVQRESDFVIFQSQYCRDTQLELSGWLPERHAVLHNCAPPMGPPVSAPRTKKICWLSGVFTPSSGHILTPCLEAFELLARKHGEAAPKLIIAGVFPESKTTANWTREVFSRMDQLQAKEVLQYLGPYRPAELPALLRTVSVALHLKYKDDCPNAVVERMGLGIPHIFSQSGGTPELVGDAGIGIAVSDSWEEKIPVAADKLALAIEEFFQGSVDYRSRALQRAQEQFSWENYLEVHRRIFAEVLEGP